MTSATPGDALEDRLAFLLRHAAGDRDDRVVALFRGQLAQLAQPRVELLLRALADAAGVDDDDVGVGRVVGRLEAGLFEQAGHPLGVVDVHLAAEGLDQVFARHVRLLFGVSPAATFAFAFRFRFAFRLRRADAPSSISRADRAKAIGDRFAAQHPRELVDAAVVVEPARPSSACGPRSTRFSIWKCVSAYAAICGRWVMQST